MTGEVLETLRVATGIEVPCRVRKIYVSPLRKILLSDRSVEDDKAIDLV